MPVNYDIFSDLNLVIYVCKGAVTPVDFFQVADMVTLDPRLKAESKVIIDFSNADLESNVSDLHLAITKEKEAKQRGQRIGPTAVLTRSSTLKYAGEALRLLSMDSMFKFGIFHTDQDVIHWLELPETETLRSWSDIRSRANQDHG